VQLTILRKIFGAVLILGVMLGLAACGGLTPNFKASQPLSGGTINQLKLMGSSPGEAMMIRIFKQTSELEVWKRTGGGSFKLFKTYEICAWSGDLGPKIKEGDRQSPEGFYTITPALLNPNSSYYLSFNTGFPNKFDRSYGRSGADLMVHGDCSSRGCYAMTDDQIAEIYALARESFKGGNPSFQLQIFPFRMTPQNLASQAASPNLAFWRNIKEGYDRFELTRKPPVWDVCNRQYVFDVSGPNGSQLDAQAACPALSGDPTMVAALKAKQAVDDSVFVSTVATLEEKQVKAAADAEAEAKEQAALKARGEAIGGFFTGITSGLFGGEDQQQEVTAPAAIDPSIVAPVPAPRINRG
jgi:murein L,D-transpeptidase YafK